MNAALQIREALNYIPAHDRDLWVKMAMAVKSELGDDGFHVWDAWSQTTDNYRAGDAKAVWRSVKPDRGVTAGTLYHEAKQRGWKPNGALPRIEEQKPAAPSAANDEANHTSAAERARQILAAATGEPKTHPYWCKKTVSLGPLVKRGAWPQRGWTDALLVPIYQPDGKVWGIEAINENGEKDTLRDCRKGGGFYPFGKIRGASRVLIGEGVATVAAVLTADASPAAAALAAGNLKPVALWAREVTAPGADIIILADFDPKPDGSNPGMKAAREAARAVGGRVAIPELDGRAGDFWDVWAERGQDAIQHALANAQAPGKVETSTGDASRVELVCGADIRPEPIEWLWHGWLAAGKLHMIAGAPEAGKTSIALALAATLSTGGRWPDGTRSSTGSVVIWSGEDAINDTLIPRLVALCQRRCDCVLKPPV